MSLFQPRKNSTTGKLLIAMGMFAAENSDFSKTGNKAAGKRARKHLSEIMKLAKVRRAEISAAIKAKPKGRGKRDESSR